MIVVEQIRGARAMLGIKQGDLARRAGISVSTLNNIERGVQTDPKISTLRAIQHALEQDGIEFAESEAGRIGIYMRRKQTAPPPQKILIIDDSDADRALYKNWLQQYAGASYDIREADNAREGYVLLLRYQPDFVVLDAMMYGMNGLQLLADFERDRMRLPPALFITESPDPAVARVLHAHGIERAVAKKELTRERFYSLLKPLPSERRAA